MSSCKCGCGVLVHNQFVSGHNTRVSPPSKRGRVPWNKGQTKETNPSLVNLALSMHGNKNGARPCSDHAKRKISLANTGSKRTEEQRHKMSLSHLGKPTWNKGKLLAYDVWNKGLTKDDPRVAANGKRVSQSLKAWWDIPGNKSQQITKMAVSQCPNKAEIRCLEYLNTLEPNTWTFVGNGALIINNRKPDFWDGGTRLVELYGDYWHRGQDPQERIDLFKQHGYDCVVIWESELKELM